MGERTSYSPGTFSWTDLGTSDADGAKRFYGALFGWEFEDMPAGDDATYTMARRDGKDVAALYAAREGQPTAWGSYVTVESADAAAAKAKELGGTVIVEPFDVLEVGRMAAIQDPTGAVVSVWEPRESIGADLVNGPGLLSLTQLNTTDPDRAGEFYAGLLGWRVDRAPGTEAPYWASYVGERLNAGMMQLPPDAGAPSHWLVYFGSEDVDADAERIGELGGSVLLPPMDVPGGRVLVATDPQGAAFALFAGNFDD